jgi:hypothetical protein
MAACSKTEGVCHAGKVQGRAGPTGPMPRGLRELHQVVLRDMPTALACRRLCADET